MAPEEFRRRDHRHPYHRLESWPGIPAVARRGDDERAWRGTAAQLAVVDRFTVSGPVRGYPKARALANAWHAVTRAQLRHR